MKGSVHGRPDELKEEYEKRLKAYLEPWSSKLGAHIARALEGVPRIERIITRSKSAERFCQKAVRTVDGTPKYSDPLNQIQDQIGARIITYYPSDLESVASGIVASYRGIEDQVIVPDSESEFGYEGRHFILFLPREIRPPRLSSAEAPKFFELQVKTLFQHAWAEASHDIAYKAQRELTKLERRKVAFTAAQAWGADTIFEELFSSDLGAGSGSAKLN